MGYGRTEAADGRVFPWVFPLVATYWTQADGDDRSTRRRRRAASTS